MAQKLSGSTAFVTGGSAGIGKAICEAFLQKGIKVCISDVNITTGEETLREFQSKYGGENVTFSKCDVSSEKEFEESILQAKRKFGHLDILINNAGILKEDDWEKTIDINLKGVMRGTMLALKHLSDKDGKKGGTVINTASVVAFQHAFIIPAYTASKFGVGGWTRCWGDDQNVKRTGVKVSAVCPDVVDTLLFSGVRDNTVDNETSRQLMEGVKDQMLTTTDIANAFVKVLEDEVSGALLYVSPKKEMTYIENTPYNPIKKDA